MAGQKQLAERTSPNESEEKRNEHHHNLDHHHSSLFDFVGPVWSCDHP